MNLGTIYDTFENKPIGVICCSYESGDIAYFSNNQELIDCLDILTNGPLYYSSKEKVGNGVFIKSNKVSIFDSYYLLALNYNLPLPWRILEIEPTHDDVEEAVYRSMYKLESDKNEQIEENSKSHRSIE